MNQIAEQSCYVALAGTKKSGRRNLLQMMQAQLGSIKAEQAAASATTCKGHITCATLVQPEAD